MPFSQSKEEHQIILLKHCLFLHNLNNDKTKLNEIHTYREHTYSYLLEGNNNDDGELSLLYI